MFRDAYVAHSPDGADHWPVFFAEFITMATTEPHITADELARISAPTLVVVGDDDLVSLEHTLALYRVIPRAELAVVPGTSHAVMLEKPALCRASTGSARWADAPPYSMQRVRRSGLLCSVGCSPDRDLGPAGHRQLGTDPGHMGFHRTFGDEETGADVAVGEPIGDEAGHLVLAGRQRMVGPAAGERRRGGGVIGGGEALTEAA